MRVRSQLHNVCVTIASPPLLPKFNLDPPGTDRNINAIVTRKCAA